MDYLHYYDCTLLFDQLLIIHIVRSLISLLVQWNLFYNNFTTDWFTEMLAIWEAIFYYIILL